VPSATRISAASVLLLALAAPACVDRTPRPDILLVTIDTLRRDHVGAYGSERGLTPNLDALAAEGLVHERAYTTMPTTGPAHLSAFTGLYPSEHGSRSNGEPLGQQASSRELALRLRGRGYATAAFVTTRLMTNALTGLRGFEIYDAPRGVLRPGDDAADVGQETFIRFYRAMGNYRGDAKLGTYITRIAINLSLKALKRRQTWVRRFVSRDDAETLLAEPARDGVRDVEARTRAELVHRAIGALKPDQRAVVVLRMLEGYSTRETAEMLDVPQGTVMSRLSRALEKLEGLLGPQLGPEA